jgi:hypothetical protein
MQAMKDFSYVLSCPSFWQFPGRSQKTRPEEPHVILVSVGHQHFEILRKFESAGHACTIKTRAAMTYRSQDKTKFKYRCICLLYAFTLNNENQSIVFGSQSFLQALTRETCKI